MAVYSVKDGKTGDVIGWFDGTAMEVDATGYLSGYEFVVAGATDAKAFASTDKVTYDSTEHALTMSVGTNNVTVWGAYKVVATTGIAADLMDADGEAVNLASSGETTAFVTGDTKISVGGAATTAAYYRLAVNDEALVIAEVTDTSIAAAVYDLKVEWADEEALSQLRKTLCTSYTWTASV